MESLALIAAAIVLGIVVLGIVATVFITKPPQSRVGRTIVFTINTAGIFSGTWMLLLDIGTGARLIGALVAVANVVSIGRIIQRRR